MHRNLLFNQKHFDLLIRLYKSSFEDYNTIEDVYKSITEAAIEGLNIDRASYWEIDNDRFMCLNLFDKNLKTHTKHPDLETKNLPIYFNGLKNGIAIVADDVKTNIYTKELLEDYLNPGGITDMLDLPIRKNGIVHGVFCCEHRDEPRVWKETDLAFARALCDILSLMVEQAERREVERHLLESERKLSLITKNSKDWFVIFENSKILYTSPAFNEFFGYSYEETSKFTLEDVFSKVHPDDLENVKKIVYSNLNDKIENFKYTFRFKSKKGQYSWREDSVSVIYSNKKSELYEKYISVSRDITSLKEAQIKTDELYYISNKLNEKLLDFAHIISHNIRSNTSNMSMLIDLINETEDSEEKEECLKLLKSSNDKLSETIFELNDVIDLQVKADNRERKINIKSEINNALLNVNGIIKKANANVIINIDDSLEMKTIPFYFESIILNLVSNALKYKSSERDLIIEISAKKQNTKTIIIIKDNGIGIDLIKNKDKIFKMYKTFHRNSDAKGMGLYLTKTHIGILGGTIELESKVGVGTSFILKL